MTKIFGILNLSSESFSDGATNSPDPLIASEKAIKMLDAGADVIDIGAESTRPGAKELDSAKEVNIVVPVIREILKKRPDCTISVDTRKAVVADAVLAEGARIINDVSGFAFDGAMVDVVAKHNASAVIMHMRGTPENMQDSKNLQYENFLEDVADYLIKTAEHAVSKGVSRDKIIIDPGVGFSKTVEQNIELIRNCAFFRSFGYEVLYGISRKSFIGKICAIENPALRDVPTNALHALLVRDGVDYIRTHDVAGALETIKGNL